MATQAIATQEQGRALNPVKIVRSELDSMAQQFKMALPAHISPEKFQRTVLTAVQSDPKLINADRQSLWRSCMKAAQDGLLPDGREAALVIFRTKIDGQFCDAVQYMPMVYGLRKKILQSGEISALHTAVVYRDEVESGAFVYEQGTNPHLHHKPALDIETEDDDIVAAYSVATMKDGTMSFEVMRRSEINKVRQVSQTGALGKKYQGKDIPPKGPWVDWFAEMAKKTVMRRHAKTLPMSGDLIDVEAADMAEAARSAVHVLSTPEAPPPTQSIEQSRLDQIEAAATAGETADPSTGEIISDQPSTAGEEASAVAADLPTDAGQTEAASNLFGDAHPAEMKTNEIIGKLNEASDESALAAIVAEHEADYEAMPAEFQALINKVHDKCKRELGA